MALLHQPLFGTVAPAATPPLADDPGAMPMPPPSPTPITSSPDAVGPPQELRLAGQDLTVRPPPNSLLRDRKPLAPMVVRRKERHPFRVLFKLLLVLSLFAGAAAAVWYVVLPKLHADTWAADVQPLADEVASARMLGWDHPVRVVPLDAAEYARRLAASTLGVNAATAPVTAGEWRAMGLAEGSVDLSSMGAGAVAARPAYFDVGADVVYEVDSLADPLRSIALRRALTEALIAQQSYAPTASPGSPAALAARLIDEADAASSAAGRPIDVTTRDMAEVQRDALAVPVGDATRYPVDLLIGDAGLTALFDGVTDPVARASMATMRLASDAALLDPGRSASSVPVPVSAGEGGAQRGMVYWYYVLASRLPAVQAWQSAAAWNGDDVVVTGPAMPGGAVCVSAALATVDAAGRDAMLAALTQWAAAAPPAATTTVTLTGERIDVMSCDPGSDADTITSVPTPFGDAAIERALVGDLGASTDAVRRCTVGAVRGYGIAAIVRSGDAVAANAAMSDIRNACATAG
ncbi:MAG: hypothetical protein WEB78_09600 [Ilumatobacteraceae bacterium]